MAQGGYVYDQGWPEERARLAGIEALWEPGTRALLEQRGTGAGTRVLEVGAGGGALVEWLAARGARVVATDVDTRFLEPLASDVVEVRLHDISTGPPGEEAFDVVHARLVLEHLSDRDRALDHLIAALRPGGLLLVEDYDWTGFGADPPDELSDRVVRAVLAYMTAAGFDPYYGRRLASALTARSLTDVTATGRAHVIDASSPGFAFFRLSFEQLRGGVEASGLLGPSDGEAFAALLHSGELQLLTPMLVAAAGRRDG